MAAPITTTSIASSGALTVTPSQVKVGQSITGVVSGLAPNDGYVGFTIGGVPAGTVAVDASGRATITTGVWSTGTLPVVARWESYAGGVYNTKQWTVNIIVTA
jgi:predicted alpha/beta hydrolase